MATRSSSRFKSKKNKTNSFDEIVSEPIAVVEGPICTSDNQPIVVEEEATAAGSVTEKVLSASSNPENISVPAVVGNKGKKIYRKISKEKKFIFFFGGADFFQRYYGSSCY